MTSSVLNLRSKKLSKKKTLKAIFASTACLASLVAHGEVTLQTLPHQEDTQNLRFTNWNVPVGGCIQGFNSLEWENRPPSRLSHRPALGGKTWNYSDVARWRANIASNRFVKAGDFVPGSPGDFSRIKANATKFLADSEPALLIRAANGDVTNGFTIGRFARDAAIVGLIEVADSKGPYFSSVSEWLIKFVADPANDFSSSCYRVRNPDTSEGKYSNRAFDALHFEGMVLARIAFIYDLVAGNMEDDKRARVEYWLSKMAWFHAAHQDLGLESAFPKRNLGNYDILAGNTTYKPPYWRSGLNICKESDGPECYLYTHALENGQVANKISYSSLNFNNRRAYVFMGIQTVGLILEEQELTNRAKRYHMEWLTYGVFPDGSQGEYSRNGDYGIPNQGLIYAQANIQSAMYLATWLAREGDFDLIDFKTDKGLHGTESTSGAYKSLGLVAQTVFDVRNGVKLWYQAETGLRVQQPRPETNLGEMVTRYFGGSPRDTYHELGMLAVAGAVPSVKVACNVLRSKECTELRFPGTPHPIYGTLPVDTGAGEWSDFMNFAPSALLFR